MTAKIVSAKVKITGVRPFLWHHFTKNALAGAGERKARTGTAGNDPEEWRETVLVMPDRHLYIPDSYIRACMKSAARFTKKGRGSLVSTIASAVDIPDNIIFFNRWLPEEPIPTLDDSPEAEVYIDIRGVVNPNSRGGGSRNVRYRVGTAPGWQCSFTVQWESTLVGDKEIKKVLEDAGALEGLGDNRQNGFGRFEVDSFKASEN